MFCSRSIRLLATRLPSRAVPIQSSALVARSYNAQLRQFQTSPALCKKQKHKLNDPKTSHPPSADKSTPQTDLDLNEEIVGLSKGIEALKTKLQAQITKLRTHTRNDPSVLENIQVELSVKTDAATAGHKPGAVTKEKVHLRDIAHVIPGRERTITIMVYDHANVKRIVSALQAPPHNMSPTVSTQDPLKIDIPLPPPTKQDRLKTADLIQADSERALIDLRELRQNVRKKIKGGAGRPDDVLKAEKKLDALIKDATDQFKKLTDAGKKTVLEG